MKMINFQLKGEKIKASFGSFINDKTDFANEECIFAIGEMKCKNDKSILTICSFVNLSNYCVDCSEERVIIPRSISLSLIKICKESRYIPIIIHTHKRSGDRRVSFSWPDYRYIDKFVKCADEIGDISLCVFIVTDKENIEICNWEKGKNEYIIYGGKISEFFG